MFSESTGQAVITFGIIRCISTTHGQIEVTAQRPRLGIWYKGGHFFSVPLLAVCELILLSASTLCVSHGAQLH